MSVPRPPRTGSHFKSGPTFAVDIDLVAGHLRLTGVLDSGTVPLFQESISALLLAHHDTWVLDTSDLVGCDEIGIRAIGAAYRRALRHNQRMTLTGAGPQLQLALAHVRPDPRLLGSASGAGAVPDSLPA